jgi:hypothetical protein
MSMRRIVVLIVAVGMVVVFGGVALAGSFGECGPGSQVNQATTDKADTSQPVATQPQEKVDTNKVVLVQTNRMVRPAPETNKK